MNDLQSYLAFSYFPGIGPVRLGALIKRFGSVKAAYLAKEGEMAEIIGKNLAWQFKNFQQKFDQNKELEQLKKKEIKVISREDERYPYNLSHIPDPPICLYIRGNPDVLRPPNNLILAIVGTRKITDYGRVIVRKFTQDLVAANFTIVSGMAIGIDTVSHESTIEAGGKTVAVLGCGVDIIYPFINKNLYYKIIKSRGAVVSEFPPGKRVEKGLFVVRNRIISGLSRGVLIIEGAKDSGTLITARYAAEQGREVFAPPSPLTSPMSGAPNILLKAGAKLVTTVEDIIEELSF
jgi:DNA processing protein